MHQPILPPRQQFIQNQIDNINDLHIYKDEVLDFIKNQPLKVLNRNGGEGHNLLHIACIKSATDIALALIKKGVNVNPPSDWTGNTPLISACKNSLEKVALSLIEKGAYVDVEDLNGNTPLIIACENGLEDVAMAIIKEGNIEKKAYRENEKIGLLSEQDHIGNTPLHYACLTGLKEVVKIILNKHPHLLLSTNSMLETPVHFAITYTNETNDTSIIDMIMVTNKTFTVDLLKKYGLKQEMIEKIMARKTKHSGVLSKMPIDIFSVIGEYVSKKPEPTSPDRKKRRTGGKTKRRRKTKRSKKRKSRRKKD